jgi:hypothetical protein
MEKTGDSAEDMDLPRTRKDCDLKTLPQNEWDFSAGRVDKRELPWCFRYEYARNSDSFLERTVQWRKEHKRATKHFATAIRALRRFAESGLVDDFGTLAEIVTIFFQLRGLTEKDIVEIAEKPEMKPLAQVLESGFPKALPHLTKMYQAVFGEKAKGAHLLHAACQMDFDFFMVLDERFPQQAYLDLDLPARRLKFFLLNQFFEPELDSKLDADSRLAIKGRAFWQSGHLHAGFDSQNADSRTVKQGNFVSQHFVAGVNWAHSNDAIIAEFRKWLVERRPHPHYDRARKTNERDLLRALGALRLCQAMHWRKAEQYTREVLRYSLYSGEKSWKRAVAKAKAQINEPFVPFTGLLALGAK